MFAQLPSEVQKKVLHFLEVDDFRAAKALCDQWHALDSRSESYLVDESLSLLNFSNMAANPAA